MAPPTSEPWTYESTKYRQHRTTTKPQKKVQFIDTLERRRKAFGSSFLLSSFYYLEGKEFGSLGANPFFWPMWDGGHFVPLLTRKRRLQAWQKLWYLFGGDGVRSTARDQLSRRARKLGGMGATEESAQTPAMCIFSPPTGESLGHHSSAYSTVGSMPRTGQALSPINSDLISTLDATPPASGATTMIICMRGLMTVIRAAYYQATPLGLISREKKKQPNHIWHGKES